MTCQLPSQTTCLRFAHLLTHAHPPPPPTRTHSTRSTVTPGNRERVDPAAISTDATDALQQLAADDLLRGPLLTALALAVQQWDAALVSDPLRLSADALRALLPKLELRWQHKLRNALLRVSCGQLGRGLCIALVLLTCNAASLVRQAPR